MSRFKDLIIDEEAGAEYFEQVPAFKRLSVRENSMLPLIQPSEIIFRERGVGIKELMGNRFPHEKTAEIFLPVKVTVMTFTIFNSFSVDVAELIKHASKNISLRIAFCYQGNKISGIISAFNKLFESRDDLTIQVVVNPHTHIKMLQVDDTLYMGSMNYSSTADSVANKSLSDEDYEKESFSSHEVLFYFSKGGENFADHLFDKIKRLDDSFDFEINKSNFRRSIRLNLKECRRKTIGETREVKLIQQRELDEKNKKSFMQLLPVLIHSQVSLAVRHILDINTHYRLEIDVFDDDEVEKTVRYFKENDGEVFIKKFLDMNCPGFIYLSSNADEEDDDDSNHELAKEFLSEITDNCTEHLADLVIDDDELREDISAERYDSDTGEDDFPWGDIAQEKYEERIEENKREAIFALNSLIGELTQLIIDKGFFDIDFIMNKSSGQF